MLTFAVMGNPISHSLSPIIHQAFAQQCQLSLSYEKMLIPTDAFEQALGHFFNHQGGSGCNVTVPFKERAFAAMQRCTEEAQYAKAVNTIRLEPDGSLMGHNTDGLGLVRDLCHKGLILTDMVVLILGAGGAARGVIKPLLDASVAQIYIANRTFERARSLVADMSNERCRAVTLEQLGTIYPSLIINATSSSLHNSQPIPSVTNLHNCQAAYDMVYSASPTPFMQYASNAGVGSAYDGLGMLVEQAAIAFTWWTGRDVATAEVLSSLRQHLCAR